MWVVVFKTDKNLVIPLRVLSCLASLKYSASTSHRVFAIISAVVVVGGGAYLYPEAVCSRSSSLHSLHGPFILIREDASKPGGAFGPSDFWEQFYGSLNTEQKLCQVYITREVSAEASRLFLGDTFKNTSSLCSAEWTQSVKAQSPPDFTLYADYRYAG